MRSKLYLVLSILCLALAIFSTLKTTEGDIRSTGSAFFINNNGYLVTAAHVVRGNHTVYVKYKGMIYLAKIVFVDIWNDIAFIQIQNKNTLYLRFQKNFKNGGNVYVFGYPVPQRMGWSLRYSTGTGKIGFNSDVMRKVLEVNLDIYHGDSGGALIGDYGVLGVETNGYSDIMASQEDVLKSGFGTPTETIVRLATLKHIYTEYSTTIRAISAQQWYNSIYTDNLVALVFT